MRTVITPLLLLLALFTGTAYAQGDRLKAPIQPQGDGRFLYLDGPITGQTLAPLTSALESILRAPERTPITLVLNSPGGSVIAGMRFINRMQAVKALDIEINCYVLDVAASMAFQILTQCSERYALPTSFLLWHGVRMGGTGPITTALARTIAEDLQRMDDLVFLQLEESLELDADTIQYHFDRETLWSGLGLHAADPQFLYLETAYPGILSRLSTAVTTAPPMFFPGFGREDSITYIWSRYPRIGR